MPNSPNAIDIAPTDGPGPGETLYQSSSTRVVRYGGGSAASFVRKEYMGAHAAQRMRNEKSLLKRLAGVEGVAQLAKAAHGTDALVLEDCGGTSLAQLIQSGTAGTEAVLALASQLARTLAAVHKAGIIHRDINPTNILVSDSRDAVLIDFDLAALAEQQPAAKSDGQIVGTLSYMAPEQTGRTGHAVDQRADLYSLGATLYELATGRPPFEQADPLQLIHDHLVREPIAPWLLDADVPRGLSDIVMRLLEKAPEHRYQSAEGLLYDLERLRGELEQGRSGTFELGERDFPARLTAPATLIGRRQERTILLDAFAEAMHTSRRTVLIGGPPGVGKSALIDELKPVVAQAGGWFVGGKFDQYQRDTSTSGALTQALQALGRLLLTRPAEEIAALRQRIMKTLGRNAALITRASPEFGLLLEMSADAPAVDPSQAELKLQQAMLDLLLAIVSPERPLVIEIDNLHWGSVFSLHLFERMMADPQLRGLLLIGTYRSDEIDAGHFLSPMLARWQQFDPPPTRIELKNLDAVDMSEMIRQMLRLQPQPALELAGALNVLTGGNPFDTVEMVNALRADGVLTLGDAGWQWDEIKVRRFVGRGNVVDLLAARISRLPAASLELLEYMSCLGNAVEHKLLCAAVGLTDDELQARLRAPVEDGLLVADTAGDAVRFRHDRVQQAMLGAMDDVQRGTRQLAMARRLSAHPAYESDAAQQYLACMGLLDEPEEQRRAAHLFHGLAQVLASTASYLLAERYLAAADSLLAIMNDPADAPLRRAIDVARHCALYSLGRIHEADPLFAKIQAHTSDPVELVEPTCLQVRSLNVHGRPAEALALGVRLLEQLGLHVPQDFRDPTLEQRLDALGEWVWRESQLDLSKLPQTRDPRILGIHKLLARLVGAAFLGENVDAYLWLVLEGQRQWVEHGPSDYLMGCIGSAGGLIIGITRDYRSAYEVARHVIKAGETLGFEVRTAGAQFTFCWGPCVWFEPLENALDYLNRAFEVFQAGGDDPSFACYFHTSRQILLLEIAPTIEVSEAGIESAEVLCRRTGNIHATALHMTEQQFLRALRGLTKAPNNFNDPQFDERDFRAKFGHLSRVQHNLVFYHALQSLIWGDAEAVARYASVEWKSGSGRIDHTFYWAAHQYLIVAMARAWQLRQGNPAAPESAALISELEFCSSWLAARAVDQPYNYLHLSLLAQAEQAWTLGDLWKAASSFDAAVLEAETRQRPWHRALITERAGLFNLAQGLERAGRDLLARARDDYQAWGASAKVEQMEREHAFLRARARRLASQLSGSAGHSIESGKTVSSDVLDLVGVLRASQALSSETSHEHLTARVTEVLASLSGATKVLVLSSNDGKWWLHSPTPDQPSIPLSQAAERALLPVSAFAYVERTNETLVVDDAISDFRFSRDPYFAGVAVCSLLLVPISGQGKARAMLLLENRLGRAAFNAQRLDAVMLIAGQLAVSLANAQLYESLEQRVQARTRELQETQEQLVTTARRAGMAEIANNVLHNVGNVLNSINVSANVLRNTIANSKVEGLGRALQLLDEHEHDLPQFLESDPRGKALRPYLNQLLAALRAERQDALSDLDRLSLSVDHITYVVSTQQAHAGPSSVLELAHAEELIDQALHLSAETVKRYGVVVVRRIGDVPPCAVDRQRLVQILVNLVRNAAQAMERMPEGSRQLTVSSARVKTDEGERLRFTVQDTGEGIDPENLTRIFAHGFTTRASGHGFGLHSSAVAASEMGGKLTVHSDGAGRGATFTIDMPHQT
jgi:predicted ATPase/signal transduction histidine kinase/predicted Ser/Thr protein kinase